MNPKIQKFRDERNKNDQKIAALKEKNRVLDERILKLENTEIIGMVRERKITPEQLAAMLHDVPLTEVQDDAE